MKNIYEIEMLVEINIGFNKCYFLNLIKIKEIVLLIMS